VHAEFGIFPHRPQREFADAALEQPAEGRGAIDRLAQCRATYHAIAQHVKFGHTHRRPAAALRVRPFEQVDAFTIDRYELIVRNQLHPAVTACLLTEPRNAGAAQDRVFIAADMTHAAQYLLQQQAGGRPGRGPG